MIAPVYTLLTTNADVFAMVANRVFPAGNIPQKQLMPAITWQVISGVPQNTLSDNAPVDNQRIQIDCWATTFEQADELADKVRLVLQEHGHCISENGHDYDAETSRFRISRDYSFWLLR